MKKLINRLLVKESYNNKHFIEYITHKNILRSRVFAITIMVIEALMIVMTVVKPDLFNPKYLVSYRIHHIVMFLIAAIMSVILVISEKNKIKKVTPMYLVFVLLLLFGLSWGASVSLMDASITESISIYLTFVFILSVAVLNRPDYFLVTYLLVHSIFLYLLPSYQFNDAAVFSNQLNSTFFVIFAWFVSRSQYLNEFNNYLKDVTIEDKNNSLEKKNSELIQISMIDSLTSLYNRRTLDIIFSKLWNEAYLTKQPVLILMLDIDRFKHLNDTYGHVKGDECLVKVSKLISEISDEYKGHAFRYGGDEFCLVFLVLNDEAEIIDKILSSMKKFTLNTSDGLIGVKLTVGSSKKIPENSDDYWSFIEYADHNLYEFKRRRKLRVTDDLIRND